MVRQDKPSRAVAPVAMALVLLLSIAMPTHGTPPPVQEAAYEATALRPAVPLVEDTLRGIPITTVPDYHAMNMVTCPEIPGGPAASTRFDLSTDVEDPKISLFDEVFPDPYLLVCVYNGDEFVHGDSGTRVVQVHGATGDLVEVWVALAASVGTSPHFGSVGDATLG